MRADELDHKELLDLDADGGLIHFAGQRALLVDAVAMGLLRKYLVENFGLAAARTVLTQFGFAHGWRMAEALRAEFEWDSDEDWARAGSRLHTLEGLFRVEPGGQGALAREGMLLGASYEAEQHLLHFGRSEVPVCWTISGLQSGYLSRCAGKEIYVLEDRCIGKGDAACQILGRTRGSFWWGLYYVAFVTAASIHGAIGVRSVLREWGPRKLAHDERGLDFTMWVFGSFLFCLGLRAVWAVVA